MKVLHVFTLSITAESFFDGQFRFLSKNGQNIHMAAATEPSQGFCEKNLVCFHKINIARRIDIHSDLKAIKALCSLIKREDFDIVVGHTPKGALIAMIASWLCRVKHRLYYRHGLIYTTAHGVQRRIFKVVEQFTASLATKIINVSLSLSKLAIEDSLNSDQKQIVIGQGTCGGIDALTLFNPDIIADLDKKNKQSQLKFDDNDFVIGFCGRLCNDKGIAELVEGFKLFQSRNKKINTKILLVGPFDERDVLSDGIRSELLNNPSIIVAGHQPKECLPILYSLMDVFVFPSYREGFGMCVIEASAMKIPILVSRSHGCVDSIKENITGQYIDISPQSIASGLTRMLDTELRHQLGKEGRKFVLNKFDYKVMWPLIKQLYDEIAANKK